MPVSSISVSLRGDKVYRSALGAVADRHDMNIGDLVRDAIDSSKYGDELKRVLAFFAAEVGSSKNENDNIGTDIHRAHTTDQWDWAKDSTDQSAPVPGAKNG